MARIKLTDKYFFEVDDNQYILIECGVRKKTDRKTRKVLDEDINYEDVLGYYTSLKSMLLATVEYDCRAKVRSGEVDSIQNCIKSMDNLYENILDKTKGF